MRDHETGLSNRTWKRCSQCRPSRSRTPLAEMVVCIESICKELPRRKVTSDDAELLFPEHVNDYQDAHDKDPRYDRGCNWVYALNFHSVFLLSPCMGARLRKMESYHADKPGFNGMCTCNSPRSGPGSGMISSLSVGNWYLARAVGCEYRVSSPAEECDLFPPPPGLL